MYAVALAHERAEVFFQDIEGPRVLDEERFEELGYRTDRPCPGMRGRGSRRRFRSLPSCGARSATRSSTATGRRAPTWHGTFVDVLDTLRPEQREYDVAGELAGRLAALGFTTPVVLVGGEQRAPVYRHPLPDGRTARHASPCLR